jgi:hypothetical protein
LSLPPPRQACAAAALCNLALDFASAKAAVLEAGGLEVR